MTDRLTLSVDTMGGDAAPEMVIAGVDLAARRHGNVDFLLFGDEKQLLELLEHYPQARQASRVCHTADVVGVNDKPAVALRSGRQSSMRKAIDAVGSGAAAGIISAGNTGALMAMAKFVLKTLPGISRPAIATSLPTQRGDIVMLDLGANVDCNADNLVQFAVMGEVFARNVLGLQKPSVGILNIGAEVLKGNEAVKTAAAILKESHLPISFYGFVEGDDIAAGTVDVVVTDGFTGNIALKTTEGTAKFVSAALKQALMSSLLTKIGAFLARPALNKLKMKMDPRRYNGAMFLGLNGICVKSHGGTDALGFANAIDVSINLIEKSITDSIKLDYAKLHADAEQGEQAAVK